MNKLADWLHERRIKRQDFAAMIGISRPYVSAICADPPHYWPSRDVFVRIREATDGAVLPNDFLPIREAAE